MQTANEPDFRALKKAKKTGGAKTRKGVQIEGFTLTAQQYQRFCQLSERMKLRDPATFNVELHASFWAYGFVEVIENALRSVLEASNAEDFGLGRLLLAVLPMTVFFRRGVARAIKELEHSAPERVADVLDCIADLWKAAAFFASKDQHHAQQMADLRGSLEDFARSCVDVWDLHADWRFLFSKDCDLSDAVDEAKQAIESHLRRYHHWMTTDEELLVRQKEMIVTAEMVKAMRSTDPSEANDEDSVHRDDANDDDHQVGGDDDGAADEGGVLQNGEQGEFIRAQQANNNAYRTAVQLATMQLRDIR